jgi:hypothetical protein
MKPGRAIKRRGDRVADPTSDSLNESDHGSHDRIALLAYQLYERRGWADGHALDDWLEAEAIVNGKTE